ncbi:TPA: hypothetical protein ACH6AG_000022 [Campylobacter jejuni]
MSAFEIIDKGSNSLTVIVLMVSLGIAVFAVNKLFEKHDAVKDTLSDIKKIETKTAEAQDRILSELKLNNGISKAQLESSNKIIELHSHIIGDKLDRLDKTLEGVKNKLSEISAPSQYRNSELIQEIKKLDERNERRARETSTQPLQSPVNPRSMTGSGTVGASGVVPGTGRQ